MPVPQQDSSLLVRLLAVWGAITGSIALIWDFYKWKTSGPKIRMMVSPNMVTATPGVGVDKTLHIQVTVTNVGTAKTTLKTLGVACYSSEWNCWRNRPSRTYVVVNTGHFCEPLPHILDVGEEWRPFLQQTELLMGLSGNERVYFQLWHSASVKPVCARLLVPDEKPRITRVLLER